MHLNLFYNTLYRLTNLFYFVKMKAVIERPNKFDIEIIIYFQLVFFIVT
jgi:hypothetical protein